MNNSLEKAGELISKYQESISSNLAQLVEKGKFTEDDLSSACMIDLVNLVLLLESKQEKARAVLAKKAMIIEDVSQAEHYFSDLTIGQIDDALKTLKTLTDALGGEV